MRVPHKEPNRAAEERYAAAFFLEDDMRFPALRSSVRSLSFALVTGALGLALALMAPPHLAGAANNALAYDEVVRFVSGDANPQPGTFMSDYQAAVNAAQQAAAAQNAPQGHGLFGALKNVANMMKTGYNSFKTGIPSREYYLGDLHRTDDPGAQTALIERPDQHRKIKLDFAKKTYEIIDEKTTMPMAVQAPQSAPQQGTPPPTPQPGTADLNVTVRSSSLGPKTIEGVPTMGYSFSFKGAMTNATGSCRNGSFETSSIEYVSNYPEPGQAHSHATGGRAPAASDPEMAAVAPGCRPRITRHISNGGQAPTGRLSMFSVLGLGGSVQSQGQQAGGKFQTIIERGNVRVLTGADRNLFEIPAGFTQAVPSPTPSP